MPNRTHKSTTRIESYEVKAKSLRKGDTIWLGKRSYTVKSNRKNDLGKRVIELRWGTRKEKDAATLVVPGKSLFGVRKSTYTRH